MSPVPEGPRPWLLRWPGLALALALAAAWRGSGASLAVLVGAEARGAALDFARGFWPPAHDVAFLAALWRPLAETVCIAFLGMALGLLAAVPLSLAATSPAVYAACGGRRRAEQGALFVGTRALLDLLRSIPEIVWALLFVRALGIGPAAGVLALGLSYAGVLGKVFAEILESAPRGAAEALGAAGASPAAAFAFGVLPAARPVLTSYALYRFDCALRASAVLGIVGAGGLGQQIELSLKMLRYDEVATFVLALFLLVALVDLASQAARRRLLSSGSLLAPSRRSLAVWALGVAAFAAAAAGAARFLDVSPAAVLSRRSLSGMGAFARSLFPPDLSPALLRAIVPAAGETLAVSALGTAIAAAGGMLLAWLAAQRLHAIGSDGERAARRWARAGVAWAARGVLNVCRTLPELLWALAFIFAVGLGPFAGALALGVHTTGVLGRLYGETLEEVPEGPVAALRAAGAGRFGAFLHGALPQAFPQLVAYTLYRWEVNIRASAILGVVGAGGLGQVLYVSLSLFQQHQASTLVLAILVLVTAVDFGSGWLRDRIQGRPGFLERLRERRSALQPALGAAPGSARAY